MKNLLLVFSLSLLFFHSQAQRKPKSQLTTKTRILFVLDASNSMNAEWDGRKRIDIAREVLANELDELQGRKNLEIGLRVYGHQYDRTQRNCTDSKLEVGFGGGGNFENIKTKMNALAPKGTTPIAYSLEKAANDFPDSKNIRNVIIMITDGIESCDGDPCAISLALQKKNIFLRPFIIGLGIEDKYTGNFDCMGRFYNAKTTGEFNAILDDVLQQTLGRTTVTVELLDMQNQTKETNVNMTFINSVTGEATYDYVHYRDQKGLTDTLEIDAILTYNLVVNTVPPVIKKNIAFKGGRHNTVKVKTPQGNLLIVQQGSNDYSAALQAIVRRSGDTRTLTSHRVNASHPYLVGSYDIEVLTLPRTYVNGIKIKQDEVTKVPIDQPGVLSITNRLKGFGSLYKIDKLGVPQWIHNFENNDARQNIAMQPGKYKLVWRTKEAYGSLYTVVKKFTIKSGESTYIDLLR